MLECVLFLLYLTGNVVDSLSTNISTDASPTPSAVRNASYTESPISSTTIKILTTSDLKSKADYIANELPSTVTNAVPSATIALKNDALIPSTANIVIEKSVTNAAELEGSGEMTNSVVGGDSFVQHIRQKKQADFYNGQVGRNFYEKFNIKQPSVPPTAVVGLGRALQRGNEPPRSEFVAEWNNNGTRHWGTIYMDKKLQFEGTFIENGWIRNISSAEMASARISILKYVGTRESNNFEFKWRRAIDTDFTTVISSTKAGQCSPQLAPAVYQNAGYEMLGEADLSSRTMTYIFNGHVNLVAQSDFLRQVYLLTKQRCSCSCAGG